MDYDIAIIHKDPMAVTLSFNSEGPDVFLLECFLDPFFYGFYLGGTLSRADYKIVCDGTEAF